MVDKCNFFSVFWVFFFYVVVAFFLIKKGKIQLVTLQNNMKKNILINKTILKNRQVWYRVQVLSASCLRSWQSTLLASRTCALVHRRLILILCPCLGVPLKLTRLFPWAALHASFFFNIYFCLFIWQCQMSVAAHEIFSCGLWDLAPTPGTEPRYRALGV